MLDIYQRDESRTENYRVQVRGYFRSIDSNGKRFPIVQSIRMFRLGPCVSSVPSLELCSLLPALLLRVPQANGLIGKSPVMELTSWSGSSGGGPKSSNPGDIQMPGRNRGVATLSICLQHSRGGSITQFEGTRGICSDDIGSTHSVYHPPETISLVV